MKTLLERLQPLGRALMLPIAVLPAAALLLRLGQPDMLDIAFIAQAGNAIFSSLGLLFAIGVAVGLAKENHGAAALAGAVCYLVATKAAEVLVVVPVSSVADYAPAARILATHAYQAQALAKLGVPCGILSGLIAGWLYNRYHAIELPDYLAFFGGRRFVPIAAGFAALALGAVLGFSWPALESGMNELSHLVLNSGNAGLFIYGVLNRLLIVTGLHHIINNIAWFMLGDYHGVTGDLNRFFAGDPTAGKFMSGFFPVMMFGLPAACLAMYRAAKPERRKAVAGIYLSMALTAFLTGVTEPIEFSFMFLAPVLFVIHALLTGTAMVVMNLLGVRLGFGFSAGLFDYAINFGKATHPLLLLPVGAMYFVAYYAIFSFAIRYFDLKTLGREDEVDAPAANVARSERGTAFLEALGGVENLTRVDACTTRLRLMIVEANRIDERALRGLGARGFVRPSAKALQVVLGPIADQVAGEIRAAMGHLQRLPAVSNAAEAGSVQVHAREIGDTRGLLEKLGGAQNVLEISACSSRLRVRLAVHAPVDEAGLRALGVRSIAVPKANSVHLVVGPAAEAMAEGLKQELARR